MPNTKILKENGQEFYPVTHASLIVGMENQCRMDATYAWDGTGTPDVAKIPAGVVVTYDGTSYTGTLAASADTAGRFYLVPSTTVTGEYDRYLTDATGSTITWKPAGTTAIPTPSILDNVTSTDTDKALSANQGKLLKDDLSQLEAKVTDLQDGETVLQQQIDAINPIVIEGDVTNAPDEEDITTDENNLLKFANRSATLTNKGYKILRKDATFASQVTDINTIYEIRYQFSIAEAEVTIPSGCDLYFNGGNITGAGKLIGTNTFINSDSECFGKDVVFAGTWANETIFTKWFAFVSSDDGVTDNSICFKQLQAVINGTKGCKVFFEKGIYQTCIIDNEPEGEVVVDGVTYPKWAMDTYQVDGRVVLNIFELPFLDINLNGSTIKAIGIDCPGWNMIRLNGVESGCIHDGELVGMANGFTYPEYVNYTGTVKNNYEFASLLIQGGGFCEVSNVTCKYATGDGIMVGSSYWNFLPGDVRPSGVVDEEVLVQFPADGYFVHDCEVCNCGRNGITLHSSHNGKLANCHIHHIGSDAGNAVIGSDGIMGRDPRSGIDVEFEDGQGLKPLLQWDSLSIHDCGGKSSVFDATGVLIQFKASNCRFVGLGVINVMTADGPKEFSNCYFEHSGGDQGNLYGKDIVFRDCEIVLKKQGLMVGSNTFVNCTIIDEIAGQLSSTQYVFIQDARKDAVFRNCTITILSGHPYGYMQNWKLYGCTLNFYNNGAVNACGLECYDCTFHNDPEDSSGKSFRFANGNYPEQTRGHFWFVNCSFEKLTGPQTSSAEYAFNTGGYPVVLDGCSFNKIIFYHGTYVKDLRFNGCQIESITIMSYQDSATGVKPLKFDNCIILDYNSGQSRSIPIEVTGGRVEVVSGGNFKLQKVNFAKCEIVNNVTRGGYVDAGVNAVDCILNFVATTATTVFSIVNCYVKGQVTEASFTGTKQNCTFETPFAKSGATADRPTASAVGAGFTYFDTDLGKMIVSNGTAWVNMDGTALS